MTPEPTEPIDPTDRQIGRAGDYWRKVGYDKGAILSIAEFIALNDRLICENDSLKAQLSSLSAALDAAGVVDGEPAADDVAEGFVLVEFGVINDDWLTVAMRDADIVRRVCADDDAVIHAAIHAYLLAASNAATESDKKAGE